MQVNFAAADGYDRAPKRVYGNELVYGDGGGRGGGAGGSGSWSVTTRFI